jgi:hypothetical protein
MQNQPEVERVTCEETRYSDEGKRKEENNQITNQRGIDL